MLTDLLLSHGQMGNVSPNGVSGEEYLFWGLVVGAVILFMLYRDMENRK